MNSNENFDILDIITLLSFFMGVQNYNETAESLRYVKKHDEKLEKVLKAQEELLNGLEK